MLRGSQRPRVLTGPDVTGPIGDAAVKLAASAGLFLDEWQQLVLRRMLGEGPNGKWAAREVGFLVARQNGKGAVLEARELAGLYLLGERVIVHSAHQMKTAKVAFGRVWDMIRSSPHLMAARPRERTGNEEVSITLASGQKLLFVPRQSGTIRGFTVDVALLDEAQDLSFAAFRAVNPTMLAAPNPQTIYCGTVPGPGATPDQWTSVRDRGRRGDDPRLLWAEWNPGETWGDLDDRSAWMASNPSVGALNRAPGSPEITVLDIEDSRRSMADDPDGFAREVLSIWPPLPGGVSAFGAGLWEACGVSVPSGVPVGGLALAASMDLTHAALVAAGQAGDLVHVRPLQHGPGTWWAVDAAKAAQSRHDVDIAVDGKGPAAVLIPHLQAAGVRLKVLTTPEVFDACAGISEMVRGGWLRHRSYPELDAAVAGAVKRESVDRWAWGRRKSSSDISPLEAATFAAFQVSRPATKPPLPALMVGLRR